MSKFVIYTAGGGQSEIDISLEDYKAAAHHGIGLAQYLERRCPSDPREGTTFEQCMRQAGMLLSSDKLGYRPPSLYDVYNGTATIDASVITRNDGSSRHTPDGRLLYPEVMMQVIASELESSDDQFISSMDSMIATTMPVDNSMFDQPIINKTGPENSRAQEISQLAMPVRMVSITTGNRAYRIPTKSIMLEVSDQALKSTTLDLVGIIMAAQARGERISMYYDQLAAVINGDPDIGEPAITEVVKANVFDSTITANGQITHEAWLYWLRSAHKKRSITHVITTLKTALKLANRTGRPTVQNASDKSDNFAAEFTVDNLQISNPRVVLVDDGVIGANQVVGLDKNAALRRVINVGASYEAVEQFVLRRMTAFRVDYGQMVHKLFPDSFGILSLTI